MLESMSALFGSGMIGLVIALGAALLLALLVLLVGRKRRRHADDLVAGHRLAIIDQVQIDDSRRLVLIQRDDVQHLVILGGGSDFLVESGIGSTASAASPSPRPSLSMTTDVEPTPAKARARREPPVQPAVSAQDPGPAQRVDTSASVNDELHAHLVAPARQTISPAELEPVPAKPRAAASRAAADRTDGGRRVAVKLDPHFAGMVDQLEETLRQPAASTRREPRPTAPPAPPAARAQGPRAPAAPSHHVEDVVHPAQVADASASPLEPRDTTSSTAAAAAEAPQIIPPAPLHDTPTPAVQPVAANDRPAPQIDSAFDREMADLLGRAKRT